VTAATARMLHTFQRASPSPSNQLKMFHECDACIGIEAEKMHKTDNARIASMHQARHINWSMETVRDDGGNQNKLEHPLQITDVVESDKGNTHACDNVCLVKCQP